MPSEGAAGAGAGSTAAGEYVLHNYYRSSTSFRVRIALNLKGLPYRQRAYHLRKGEQHGADYLRVNNQGLVPALVTPAGATITQSMAILEYLDQAAPEPRLIPADPMAAARVRSLALRIACDIHPLKTTCACSPTCKTPWAARRRTPARHQGSRAPQPQKPARRHP